VTWVRTRVDRVATVNARIGWKALTASEYQPDGYVFLSTPNIKSESIDFEDVNYISEYRYEESPELKLKPGDVLLAKDGNTLGITNIVRDLRRPATVNSSIAVLRPFGIEPRFLRYALAGSSMQGMIEAIKGGMGVPHLFQWDIKRLPLNLPPLDEQRRIADFLDAETAGIDKLLMTRRAQADRLDELWASLLADVINEQAQLHGWIQLRRLVTSVEQGWSPQCDDAIAEPDEWAVLKTSAVSTGAFLPLEHKRLPAGVEPATRYQIRDGDILLTRGSGSPDHVGMAVVAKPGDHLLLLSDLLYRIRLAGDWSPEFVTLALRSKPVRGLMALLFRGQSGQTIKLRAEDIRSIEIPAMPYNAQTEIAAVLSAELEDIRTAIQSINSSLSLLAERRQALITAAVTGEITV
jgi:type I restriction enzyme, S subunit